MDIDNVTINVIKPPETDKSLNESDNLSVSCSSNGGKSHNNFRQRDASFSSRSRSNKSMDVRNAKILNFWAKKAKRQQSLNKSVQKVRYGCRQNLAKQRYRHQGRFIKKEELEKLDPDQIYDPSRANMPRLRPTFRIHKEYHCSNRSMGSCSQEEYISNPFKTLVGDSVIKPTYQDSGNE